MAEYSEKEINQQIKESGGIDNYLKETASSANESLPIMTSKNRELISVISGKRVITYNFKFTVPIKLDFFLSRKDEMYKRWLDMTCNAHMSKILFKHGVTVRHYSYTSHGTIISKFKANKSTCSKQ